MVNVGNDRSSRGHELGRAALSVGSWSSVAPLDDSGSSSTSFSPRVRRCRIPRGPAQGRAG